MATGTNYREWVGNQGVEGPGSSGSFFLPLPAFDGSRSTWLVAASLPSLSDSASQGFSSPYATPLCHWT